MPTELGRLIGPRQDTRSPGSAIELPLFAQLFGCAGLTATAASEVVSLYYTFQDLDDVYFQEGDRASFQAAG